MNKAWTDWDWKDEPDHTTPLSATNLNKLNSAIDTIDDRVVSHDTTISNKVDKTDNTLTTTSKQVVGAINEINGNRYTKTETDTLLNAKANQSTTYTKTETDELLDEKADIDGYYEELAAGTADNLVDRKGDGNAQSFTFRTSCGSDSIADDGTGVIQSIHGNTIVWNQVLKDVNYWASANTSKGTVSVSNNEITYTVIQVGGSYDCGIVRGNVQHTIGHKILFTFKAKSSVAGITLGYDVNNTSSSAAMVTGTEYSTCAVILTAQDNNNVYICTRAGSSVGDTITCKDIMLFDLTQMFGSGNEPTTVAQFKALFPLNYYAYNAGELLSFNGTGVKTNGFNQWDEEWEVGIIGRTNGQTYSFADGIRSKNFNKCLPSTLYYTKMANKPSNESWLCIIFYDADKKYVYGQWNTNTFITTPSNAHYFKISTNNSVNIYGNVYNNDICINLSWSGYRNGEYEAYWTRTLALPVSTYFANGMRSAGSVYDELTASKAITRIGVVDLGSLTWDIPNPSYPNTFRATLNDAKCASNNNDTTGMLAVGYIAEADRTKNATMYKYNNSTATYLYFTNTSYTDATAFKTAMSGVYLFYELATPTEQTIEPPLNLTYKVADFGTEQLLPENDDEPTTSPFNGIIKYSDDFTRMLATLPKSYDTTDGLDALASALATTLGTALNGTFTITRGAYDSTTKKYAWTCTFTANS